MLVGRQPSTRCDFLSQTPPIKPGLPSFPARAVLASSFTARFIDAALKNTQPRSRGFSMRGLSHALTAQAFNSEKPRKRGSARSLRHLHDLP